MRLPEGITSEKTFRPDGSIVYDFWHEETGKLGRIVISEAPPGSPPEQDTLFSWAIFDLPDGLGSKREKIMREIVQVAKAAFKEKNNLGMSLEINPTALEMETFDSRNILAMLETALEIEKYIKRPWPDGISLKKALNRENLSLIYYFEHEKMRKVGRVTVFFRGGSFDLSQEISLEPDEYINKRMTLMDEIFNIINESFASRENLRKNASPFSL